MKQFKIKHILYFLCITSNISFTYPQKQPFTFMINPFGDAGNAGRIIDGCYERGLTLQCAEELKQTLKKKSHIHVILTRFPGERLEHLQNAHFANRLKTDLYLNIQFYFQEHDLPQVTMYYYIQQPTDLWIKQSSAAPAFIPYNQAHYLHSKQTQILATQLVQEFESIAHSYNFAMQGVFACPFKPLIGIQAPALALEIGLKSKDDWQRFVKPIALCIEKVIASLQSKNAR